MNTSQTNTSQTNLPNVAILDDYYSRAHAYADRSMFAQFEFFEQPIISESKLVAALKRLQSDRLEAGDEVANHLIRFIQSVESRLAT